MITAARKGTPESFGMTQSWLHNHRVTMPTLHTTLRERYADRTGGYARIHLTGSRVGDRADMAILELVDGPGELRFEMLARKLGRKVYEEELCVLSSANSRWPAVDALLISAAFDRPRRSLRKVDVFDRQVLGDYANWHLNDSIQKALRYRPEEAQEELRAKAEAYRVRPTDTATCERPKASDRRYSSFRISCGQRRLCTRRRRRRTTAGRRCLLGPSPLPACRCP